MALPESAQANDYRPSKVVNGFSVVATGHSNQGEELTIYSSNAPSTEVERCFDDKCLVRQVLPFKAKDPVTVLADDQYLRIRAPAVEPRSFIVVANPGPEAVCQRGFIYLTPAGGFDVASLEDAGHHPFPPRLNVSDLNVVPQTSSLFDDMPLLLRYNSVWLQDGLVGLSDAQKKALQTYVRHGGLVVSTPGVLALASEQAKLTADRKKSSGDVVRKAGAVPAQGVRDGAGAWVVTTKDIDAMELNRVLWDWFDRLNLQRFDMLKFATIRTALLETIVWPSRVLVLALLVLLAAWVVLFMVYIRKKAALTWRVLLPRVILASAALTFGVFAMRYLMAPSAHKVLVHILRADGTEYSVVECSIHVLSLWSGTADIEKGGRLALIYHDERPVKVKAKGALWTLTGAALQPVLQTRIRLGSGQDGFLRPDSEKDVVNERFSDADKRVRSDGVERSKKSPHILTSSRDAAGDLHLYIEGELHSHWRP